MNKIADIVVREKTVKCKRDKEVTQSGIDTTRTSSYFAKEKQFYMKCHGPCVEVKTEEKKGAPSISQRASFCRSCSDYFRLLIELLSIRTILENFICPPYRVSHVFK